MTLCRDCFASCHGFAADGTNLVASVAVFGAGGCFVVFNLGIMPNCIYIAIFINFCIITATTLISRIAFFCTSWLHYYFVNIVMYIHLL